MRLLLNVYTVFLYTVVESVKRFVPNSAFQGLNSHQVAPYTSQH